jgi:acyl-CoA oxidase
MQSLYKRTRADISKGDFSRLAELHSQSSGLKSLCTDYAANGIEACRRALGGHGFGGGSGLIQLNNDYLSKPTVEGDNWMITQQTASYLIKRMAAAEAGKGEPQDEVERSCREYLVQRDRLSGEDFKVIESDADIVRDASRSRAEEQGEEDLEQPTAALAKGFARRIRVPAGGEFRRYSGVA